MSTPLLGPTPMMPTPSGGLSVYGEDCVQGHTAIIFDRGGTRRLWQLTDLTSVSWGRERSKKTQAVITVSGRSCREQANVLGNIEPRRHEMRLYRGSRPVWEGPVVLAESGASSATITANDVLEYIDGTVLSRAWPLETGKPVSESSSLMTERVRTIIDHELTTSYTARIGTGAAAHDVTIPRWEQLGTGAWPEEVWGPPANLLPFIDIYYSDTLLTRSDTIAFEMTLGEHLYNLSRGGLDFTVVGRRLVFWDSALALGRTRTLTEADFYGDGLKVFKYGADHFGIGHVSGQPADDGTPSVGNAGEADSFYGVWTTLASLSSEEGTSTPTQNELNSQAQRDLVGRTPVPSVLRVADGGLRLDDTLTINHLIPGVEVNVRATLNLRKVAQMQLLDKVQVSETSAGETVQVTLVPSGRLGRVA